MISRDEVQDLDSITKAIRWREHAVKNLKDGLKYADHGAWGQDKQRIRDLEDEIRKLIDIKKELADEHTRA